MRPYSAHRVTVSAIVLAIVFSLCVHDAGRPASAAAKTSEQVARECAQINVELAGSGQDSGLGKEISDLEDLLKALGISQYWDRTDLGEYRAGNIAASIRTMTAPEGSSDRVIAIAFDDYSRRLIHLLEQRIAVRQAFIDASLSLLNALRQQRAYLKDREAQNRCAGTQPGGIAATGASAVDPVCAQLNARVFGEDGNGGTAAQWRHVKTAAIPGAEYQLKVDKQKLDDALKAQSEWLHRHGAPPAYEEYSQSPWPAVDAFQARVSRDADIIQEYRQELADLTRGIAADRTAMRARGCAERGEAGRAPTTVAHAGTSAATPRSATAVANCTSAVGDWGWGKESVLTFSADGAMHNDRGWIGTWKAHGNEISLHWSDGNSTQMTLIFNGQPRRANNLSYKTYTGTSYMPRMHPCN